jgi:hypothetical protein
MHLDTRSSVGEEPGMIKELTQFASWYSATKHQIMVGTGTTQSLLHVHAGLLIFVVAALLLRKRMKSPVPIGLVVFFAVLNEVVDRVGGKSSYSLEPLADVVNTVFWPAVLFVIAKRGAVAGRRS